MLALQSCRDPMAALWPGAPYWARLTHSYLVCQLRYLGFLLATVLERQHRKGCGKYVCIHTYTHPHTHTHTHTHMHACTHECTHTHAHTQRVVRAMLHHSGVLLMWLRRNNRKH